ncbi:piggyBac transposable element-derived protein 4-like [Pectinophora gossypiella]|uniref:piggyBac transposable element-derived protein 4-like n=1 Tax=Pectinophora gossypiella TaxID=13191 RepID=UPI00214E9D99|nr:piggyBac transposable element-derived protein 4-like [Pectinophora gossypiella]
MDAPSTSSATPSTSGPKPLVVGKKVVMTPEGTLTLTEDVLLEKTASGRLKSFCPETIHVGEGLSLIDEGGSHLRPRNLFPETNAERDEGDIFDEPLAQALAGDSGSEADDGEELTLEELQQILETAEDEAEDTSEELQWSEDFSSFRAVQEDFNESVGPKIVGTRPFALFQQIWDQPLMESIATETNRFAWQHIAPHFEVEDELAEKSRLRQWADTSVGELYKLFSVLLLMGMCVRGRLDEYWSTGILGMPGFRKIMQKDRFLLLMRFLHFADNNTIHHGDDKKLAKIRPLLEHLNKKFADIYSPRREMSIDESLLLWKGRISWMQCIRSKAARFGIKT